MRLYYLANDRTRALRQYKQCVITLHTELGVKPAKKTDDIYALIIEDQPLSKFLLENPKPHHYATINESILDPPKTTTHLRHLQELLIDVESRIRRDIENIENALKNA